MYFWWHTDAFRILHDDILIIGKNLEYSIKGLMPRHYLYIIPMTVDYKLISHNPPYINELPDRHYISLLTSPATLVDKFNFYCTTWIFNFFPLYLKINTLTKQHCDTITKFDRFACHSTPHGHYWGAHNLLTLLYIRGIYFLLVKGANQNWGQ